MLTADRKERYIKEGRLPKPKPVKKKKQPASIEERQLSQLRSMAESIDRAVKTISEKKSDFPGKQIASAIMALSDAVDSLKNIERKVEVNIPDRPRPSSYKIIRNEHNNLTEVVPIFKEK